MKKVALILSGCGYMDGSEIHETVACMYALEEAGLDYDCWAPETSFAVIDHCTKAPTEEKRSAIKEAARIARSEIGPLQRADPSLYAAALYPGGRGAASTLCSYAQQGSDHALQAEVKRFAEAMAKQRKPQGFICIAPVLVPKIYGSGVKVTVGNDPKTLEALSAMGASAEATEAGGIVVDEKHKVVTTGAYMIETNVLGVFLAVRKVVSALAELM